MDFVEDFLEKKKTNTKIGKRKIFFFCHFCFRGHNHLSFNQCLTYFDSFKLSGMFEWRVWSLSCLLRWATQSPMTLFYIMIFISIFIYVEWDR